jgi:ribosomal protein L37E
VTVPAGVEPPPKPLGPHARNGIVTDIRGRIRDLTKRYDHDGKTWPALLRSLDYPRTLTTPPDDSGRAGKPGSRPPYNMGWTSHARQVRDQAVKWDRDLRHSTVPRTPEVALRAIPNLADTADDPDLRELGHTVHHWHQTACILLGYHDPRRDTPQHHPAARCLRCGEAAITVVVTKVSANCDACGEEYPHSRLLLLMRAAERQPVLLRDSEKGQAS